MNCKQIHPNLLEYSLLSSNCPDYEAISAHLDTCEACRNVLAQEHKMAASLNHLGRTGAPSDVWPIIRAEIRHGIPFWRRLTPRIVWSNTRRMAATGVAVCVAALTLFVGIAQYDAPDQTSAVSHLVEMQRQSQASTAWADDPLSSSNDQVLNILEEGS